MSSSAFCALGEKIALDIATSSEPSKSRASSSA